MHSINISGFEAYCTEQRGLAGHTLRAYRQDLTAFQQYVAKLGDDGELNKGVVLAFQKHLREVNEASPATVRRRMVTLRAYFAWAEVENAGFVSPFAGLRLDLRVPQRLPRPVDRPTLAAIFRNSKHIAAVDHEPTASANIRADTTKDQMTGLAVRLLVVTGLRIGELTHIRVRDVSGAGSQIRVVGKGNRERTVYVTNERLLSDFSTHLRQRQLCGDADAYVFLNTRGNRLTEAAFRKRLRNVSKTLQIAPYITPHRFRHSAATLLIEEGVDIRIVQRLLGHASISTTEIYTKVSDNSLFQAIECADTLAKVDS